VERELSSPGGTSRPEARRFSIPVRVYYQDTDAGGVVFHATYFDFMERARMDWLRAIGFEIPRMVGEHGAMFVVRSASIEYLRPALLDDALDVSLALVRMGGAQLVLDQRVARAQDTLVTATIQLACIGVSGLRPARLPEPLRAECARWLDQETLTA
jgi:acyl-CoA thioester hydrolase